MNRALILLLVGVALFVAGYFTGTKAEHNANEAEKKHAQDVATELHNAKSIVGERVERETVQQTTKTEAVFNGINQGVITYAQNHPVADNCRLDDDGLRLWLAANQGTNTHPAAVRDAGVPGAAATAERSDDGSADQSHRGGQGVSPVPGSAPGADQLAGEH